MKTYKQMTAEHLGENATLEDLKAFGDACAARQRLTGESDEQVTAWYWGSGDWGERIKHPAGCSCGSPDCPESTK